MKPLSTRQTLISRAIDQRDDLAWQEFVDYYKDYLMQVLIRIGLSSQDCQDIIQNTILKVWECLPKFQYDQTKGRFRSWLTQIAINNMKEYLRKNSRLKKAFDSGKLERGEENQDSELDKIIEQEWESYIAQTAWKNIAPELSDKMLKAFEMFIDGEKDSHIANSLDLSLSSIRVYRQRTRHRLSQEVMRLETELG